MTEAEKIYGAKTGETKMMYVVKKVYAKMPIVLKTFMSEKQLEKIIENVLKKAKNLWAENQKIIKGSDDEWQ